jgi:cytochrome P450 family 4
LTHKKSTKQTQLLFRESYDSPYFHFPAFIFIPFFSANGVTIPAGCQVGVLSDTLHRRKDVWGEDADEFKPERFQPDITRHLYSYMPFSGGPRICIGYKYAYMSMKITMAFLLRRFVFNTDLKLDDLRWDISITLKLLNKHMVTAENRVW